MTFVLFLAVFAAVGSGFWISQQENLIQLLFNGSDAAGILAAHNIFHLFGEMKLPFFYNCFPFDDIHRDVVIDKTQHIQIQSVDVAFYLQNIFLSHFVAAGVFDNGNAAVQLIQL